ncbi:fibulin-1-like isoform X2 [Ornithodoros turicata]|uniref:fibulin-1-like isoform X2 n=1 Tax=Ornithodoros turicata TaxID=34597 RepID=UPI003138B485
MAVPRQLVYAGVLVLLLFLELSHGKLGSTFQKCCQEGNQWAGSSSNCDGLSLRSVFSDVPVGHEAACQVTKEICCRAAVREKLCEDGKAAARRQEACVAVKDLAGADTYKDCCDGCRLGLTAAKLGSTCALDTFSLGAPWDGAFYHCCTGHGDFTDAGHPEGNEVPKGPSERLTDDPTDQPACEAGFKYNTALRDCIDVDECSEGLNDCALEDQVCLNTYGGFQCLSKDREDCPAGYKREGGVCEDVDECAEPTLHACEAQFEEECKNTVGGYVCEPICKSGYRFNNYLHDCVDVNECADGSHTCSHSSLCINKPGKFGCKGTPQCMHGFRFNAATKTCVDVDECAEESHDCTPGLQICLNRNGSYSCRNRVTCPRGFRVDEETGACTDVDECLEDIHACSEGEMCVNGIGSYSCVPSPALASCPNGYKRNETTAKCDDINECEEYSHTCVGHLECINTPGSYLCEVKTGAVTRPPASGKCASGLRYDQRLHACKDIDECEELRPCKPNEKCRNFYGGYKCSCQDGFQRDEELNVCKDINECQYGGHNCQIGFRCDNTPGAFTCVRISGCGTGYTVNAITGQCEDDDECALGLHNCGNAFVCRNTEGSFRCDRKTCPAGSHLLPNGECQAANCGVGMTVDSSGTCVDINECLQNRSLCSRYHRCVNTPGSYICESLLSCSPGFRANPEGTRCVDVDECADGTHTCMPDQTCDNRPGGYSCGCPTGYHMNADRHCEDVDECSRYHGKVCAYNSECRNTPGSYVCDCKEGFKSAEEGQTCIDVDECQETDHGCEHNCVNVWGSYQCTCNVGFKMDEDERRCLDIDECELWKGRGRLCIGTCINDPGSYSCSCPDGYSLGGDKRTCEDIDECEQPEICNAENEVCLNTRGGYRCNVLECPPGYYMDKDHKSRCKRTRRECPMGNVSCVSEPASYSYNYFTLTNNMRIPGSGHLDFFTMRGPRFSFSRVIFELDLVEARATSSSGAGVEAATREHFHMRRTSFNEAMLSLIRPLQGPQDIQLQLRMKIYQNGLYAGNAVAKIFIYVTEHDF